MSARKSPSSPARGRSRKLVKEENGYEKIAEWMGLGILHIVKLYFRWWIYTIPGTVVFIVLLSHTSPVLKVFVAIAAVFGVYYGFRKGIFHSHLQGISHRKLARRAREDAEAGYIPDHKVYRDRAGNITRIELMPRAGQSVDTLEKMGVGQILAAFQIPDGRVHNVEIVGHQKVVVHLEDEVELPATVPITAQHVLSLASSAGDREPFRVALGPGGEWLTQDYWTMPHLLVIGKPGSGKSVTVLFLVLCWLAVGADVVFLDPKKLDGAVLNPVARVETELEGMVKTVQFCETEMNRRLDLCRRYGVNHAKDLPREVRPKELVVVIEEVADLLDTSGTPVTSEAKTEKGQRAIIQASATTMARLARAARMRLILCAQRPDASIISGQLKAQIAHFLVLGEADPAAGPMVGASAEQLKMLDGNPGRVLVSVGGEEGFLLGQAPWLPEDEQKWVVGQLQGWGVRPIKFDGEK